MRIKDQRQTVRDTRTPLIASTSGQDRCRGPILLTLATLLIAALTLTAAPAQALVTHKLLHELNGSTTPAGSFSRLLNVAVVDANGAIYVSEGGHSVIDIFGPAGNYLTQINEAGLSFPIAESVSSAGEVLVLTFGPHFEEVWLKFTPSSYPVTAATTYT